MADERKDAIAGISPELRQQENRCKAERSWADAHWLLDDESPACRQVVRKRGKADANDVNRKIIDRAARGSSAPSASSYR